MKEKTKKPDFEGLSLAEIQEINAEISEYEDKMAVSTEALKIVQKYRRWVSDECLVAVAELLDIPPAHLECGGNFRQPDLPPTGRQDRYSLLQQRYLLDAGQRSGRRALVPAFERRVGRNVPDGEYTILPIVCLGACDHAPVVMVDDELRLDITEDAVNEIFGR